MIKRNKLRKFIELVSKEPGISRTRVLQLLHIRSEELTRLIDGAIILHLIRVYSTVGYSKPAQSYEPTGEVDEFLSEEEEKVKGKIDVTESMAVKEQVDLLSREPLSLDEVKAFNKQMEGTD